MTSSALESPLGTGFEQYDACLLKLLASGDPSAMAVFQELLRSDKEAVTSLVFSLMTELGQPRLITLLQPSIENSNPAYALDACKAVISLALPSFRTRLLEYRIEFPEITH